MTSSITTTSGTINADYPVAGQDNDSQGFRDNFNLIQQSFSAAASEITALQTNALLKADLTSNAVVSNDLVGSSIHNGVYFQFNPKFIDLGNVDASGSTIDFNVAAVYKATLTANSTLTFNWTNGTHLTNQYRYAKIILIGSGAQTVTLSNSVAGSTFHVPTSGWVGGSGGNSSVTYPITTGTAVLEAWTTDSGTNIYMKNIGQY